MNNIPRLAAALVLSLSIGARASSFELNRGVARPMIDGTEALKLEAPGGPITAPRLLPALGGPGFSVETSVAPVEAATTEAAMLKLPAANTTVQTTAEAGASAESTSAEQDPTVGYSEGAHKFDGQAVGGLLDSGDGGRVLEPSFEPPSFHIPPPGGGKGGGGGKDGGDDGGAGNARDIPRVPSLSFPNPAMKGALLAVEPDKAVYGAIKRLRGQGSKDYWAVYSKGAKIDVVIRGESVYGRSTTVTEAFNKPIGKLTREDLRGTVPEYQLKAPIKQLRQMFIDNLEAERRQWRETDEPVTGSTLVRVVKFKSYLELYRETHGPDSVPAPEPVTPREPLVVKAEGPLKRLSYIAPRAVYLDLDVLEGPISKELLSDMAELMRTGVYFVAFSRKPYAAAASLKEKLIRQMSAYQLNILMPIRFMAVTDNGAVISEFPKGGNVEPVDALSFSDAGMDVLRDAQQKAAEEIGMPPRTVQESAQPAIREAADQFPGLARREPAARKDANIRFSVEFPKTVARAEVDKWLAAFERRVDAQGIKANFLVEQSPDGGWTVSVQRADMAGALGRLNKALGRKFGLYLNPSDILVLSNYPALKAANPDLDFAGLTGLKGAKMVDNALGLILGEAREKGFISGSASRISSVRRDRQKYMSEILVQQNKAEQNINFFSGHVVHSAQDWLIYQLQIGNRPSIEEFKTELQRGWDEGTREFKAVIMPEGETVDGMLRESTQRGVSMYKMVVAAKDRGEIFIGSEIPNFFMLNERQKRTGALKDRFLLHTIFDFVTLRPDPKRPGQYILVIYDFKTGPAQSRQKLDQDIQVQIYTYFARQKWVGQDFPLPYLSGAKSVRISDVKVEFIYNTIKQPTTVTTWDLSKTRATIIRTLKRIRSIEQLALGEIEPKKPAKKTKKAGAKPEKARAAKPPKPAPSQSFDDFKTGAAQPAKSAADSVSASLAQGR